MKKIYIAVAGTFILIVGILVAAFIYLDKVSHETFYYEIALQNHSAGTVKIDKFLTEDSIVYRSTQDEPLHPVMSQRSAKLILDKQYRFRSYNETINNERVSESLRVENKSGVFSFLSIFGPEFLLLSNVPGKKNAFLFQDEAVLTYLPFLKKYDFWRGRAQAFHANQQFSQQLPPKHVLLTLTSIRDDYLRIGHRRIKAECLLLKIMGQRQITLWVSKLDHSLIRLEIPGKKLTFTRSFPAKKNATVPSSPRTLISSDEAVTFQNKKIVLSGRFSVPNGKGPFPAVLLISGPGPFDNDYLGIFAAIAGHLRKNNFCVLRFDKRGIGASGGDYASYTQEEELSDIEAALTYLRGRKEVDGEKIALIGHSLGGYYALKIAVQYQNIVKGCVLMAMPFFRSHRDAVLGSLRHMANILHWDDAYRALAAQAATETIEMVKKSRLRWAIVLGKRCFLERIREKLSEKPLETVRRVKTPLLLLHGNRDSYSPPERAKAMDNFLAASGKSIHRLVYFGYLDHFFGEPILDEQNKTRYAVDEHVLEAISGWLKDTFSKVEAAGKISATPGETPAEPLSAKQ